MVLLRIILIPVSLIYCLLIYLRNKFYDFGIFRSCKVSKPVISIGNVTTGGTGKTPLTIYIARYYLSKGFKVAIISRGYKRKSKNLIIVSDGADINDSIEQSGDELTLIANELMKNHQSNFFIAAGTDRVKAAEFMISKFKPDIIILDDGFQHRRLKRDLDIVLIDSNNFLTERFLNTFTLPSGILRERFSSLNRADLIIQNNKNKKLPLIERFNKSDNNHISMRYKTEYFMDNKNSILTNYKSGAIVFSGIANNESFIEMVKESGITVSAIVKFSDHHSYTESDINSLKNIYSEGNKFITTEKDFIKIKQFTDFTNNYNVFYLKMNPEIEENKDKLYSKLDEVLK